MLKFKSCDNFTIKGRGEYYVCYPPKEMNHGVLEDLIGKEARIDGNVFKVQGLERFSIPYKRTDKVCVVFGLLVDPEPIKTDLTIGELDQIAGHLTPEFWDRFKKMRREKKVEFGLQLLKRINKGEI